MNKTLQDGTKFDRQLQINAEKERLLERINLKDQEIKRPLTAFTKTIVKLNRSKGRPMPTSSLMGTMTP